VWGVIAWHTGAVLNTAKLASLLQERHELQHRLVLALSSCVVVVQDTVIRHGEAPFLELNVGAIQGVRKDGALHVAVLLEVLVAQVEALQQALDEHPDAMQLRAPHDTPLLGVLLVSRHLAFRLVYAVDANEEAPVVQDGVRSTGKLRQAHEPGVHGAIRAVNVEVL
jgi:hypothetical protein